MERHDNSLATLPLAVRERLDIYANLLRKWQAKINLVGPSTLDDIWMRHFGDSYQLAELAGSWRQWVDLGSGAGFPGLVIAITASENGRVHLIESDRRKAAFLREVSRETGANVVIHSDRIESVLPALCERHRFDVVSARALAPMARLIDYAGPALKNGALGLFLKGKGLSAELTALAPDNNLDISVIESRTESDGRIVAVRAHNSETDRV
ncbi:16S rRNA (guanine(527)-N(7))-methyltransferase RsmG [Rhodoblastus sp.]|uniref:16S rRNA (guanine(527)-N(7))-methyltransferase RsmG n=1 Tax=Rhodoblastus sp. TaxID=1962975 RepID=UPI0035B0080E